VVHVRDVRRLALALPETAELDHWGRPSFRVRSRIFATIPDFEHLNVMIDPYDVDAVVRANPEACDELLWGKELRGVRVKLRVAEPDMVGDLLTSAWRRKAPKGLKTKIALG
jgi:hypothetical protein